MTQLIHAQGVSTASSQLAQVTLSRAGDHEHLFRLIEEYGPAPAEFMLHLSDPVIERESIFDDENEA